MTYRKDKDKRFLLWPVFNYLWVCKASAVLQCSGAQRGKRGENSIVLGETRTRLGRFGFTNPAPMPLSFVDKDVASNIVSEIARRRRQVVAPLFLCSFATYVATLVALSYMPNFVGHKIFGAVNLAYILALAQFAFTFLTAVIYSLWARSAVDPLVAEAFAILSRGPAIGSLR
jgi:uncharacterized membrane protein (DUF485 family)